MTSFLERVKNYVGSRGWTYPPLASKRDPQKLGVTTSDPEAYFAQRRTERLWLAEAIRTSFDGRPFELCSIGSGYGGEESTLLPGTSRMVLIEPDERQNDFLRRKFPSHVEVLKTFFQFCRFDAPFDVVYASALSYWMDLDPFDGINPDVLAFLHRYLKPGGLGIFLIYGGSHSAAILDKATYVEGLKESAGRAGLHVLVYGKYQSKAALLVVSNTLRQVPHFTPSLTEVYMHQDQLVKAHRADFSSYFYTFIITLHVLGTTLRKMLGDAAASFRRVRQLRTRGR